jgi:MoaA/NifB/PqqE/SkfB family radical SAM enzyme
MKPLKKTESPGERQYGFYDRLTADFPSQILVDVAEVCNLACIHCPHPDFKKSEHYAGRYLDVELNAKMVEEVRQHGQGCTEYIRYASNGEPLAHAGIYDMVECATRHSGVLVTLTTNGTFMTEQRAERLLAAGINVVDVSIDAYSLETYAKIRRQGNLDVTRANTLRLIELAKQRSSKTKVVVSYVEMPENQAETATFEAFWRDHGADYVVIRRLHSCSGAKISLAEIRRGANQAVDRRPCLYPWERICINARGDLAFCPSDWVHGSFIADYRSVTIHEVWQGEFYKRLREAHLSNDYSKHGFCGQCPDWRSTRWPHEGRSYADMMEEFMSQE